MDLSNTLDNEIDQEWEAFISSQNNDCLQDVEPQVDTFNNLKEDSEHTVPECEDLYISTKTKVLYLNIPIDINNVFWEIPTIEYWKPVEGVLKKQIKIVNNTPEEYEHYKKRLENIQCYSENIIKQIDNPSARKIKYRDERKLTVGLSKKDIMTYRTKKKNAFYNCFALIVRFYQDSEFKEVHVKVFNTGKMEIPGILNKKMLDLIQIKIIEILQPHIDTHLEYKEIELEENVLINSNFNCGFYIDRDKLHNILRSDKYGIESAYDPCSYPGVKCKYYFNNQQEYDTEIQTGRVDKDDENMKRYELDDNTKYTEISFMIFRTGSCLIVGNCNEKVLLFVFEFIKNILQNEYYQIRSQCQEQTTKEKKKKLRKRLIQMTNEYYQKHVTSISL
tara:strand:- start:3522 stop:4694 length:1173 start_codon:yes stop_codon:yes gene_type:complete